MFVRHGRRRRRVRGRADLSALLIALVIGTLLVIGGTSGRGLAAATSRASCDAFAVPGPHPPLATSAPLPSAVLAQFAVFRRAAQADDQLPSFASPRRTLDGELASYNPQFIRRLAQAAGSGYYVVPGVTVPRKPLPTSCYKRLSTVQRRLTRQFDRWVLANGNQPGYCLVHATTIAGANSQTSSTDVSCATIARSASVFSLAGRVLGNSWTVWGLSPDGVAAVRLIMRLDPPIIAPATGNLFLGSGSVASLHRLIRQGDQLYRRVAHDKHGRPKPTPAQERRLNRLRDAIVLDAVPAAIEWLDAQGSVIRHIRAPADRLGLLELETNTSFSTTTGTTTSPAEPTRGTNA